MKIFVVFFENSDDYYSHPGYCGAFTSREAAEKYIQETQEKEKVEWAHLPSHSTLRESNPIFKEENWDIWEDELKS